MTDHEITRLERLPIGGPHDHWHSVTCGCGWTGRYVSRYRAETMHARHAKSATDTEATA